MKELIPGNELTGVDICGVRYSYYIVRADLGYYMKTTDLEKGSNIELCKLHHSCIGDHYVGHINNSFYIIKGSSYRRVTDLSTDSNSECKEIQPKYQDGDYYFSVWGKFYIVFKDENIYRKTTKLTSPDYEEFPLSEDLSDGLFYWGRKLHFFMMRNSDWGPQYIKGMNFNGKHDDSSASVHKDILNFLPGGLSVNKGEPAGKWVLIKSINNDRDTTINCDWKKSKKVLCNTEMISEITKNWKMTFDGKFNIGAEIVKSQFGLSCEIGCTQVITEKESRKEETEEVEHMTLEIPPYSALYQFQYVLALGESTMVFCRDITFQESPDPPTEAPQAYEQE